MSTRVFSRFTMSEARVPRGSPPGQQIDRVRRALFPSHNCAQARQFANDELDSSQKQKSEQYNFDFQTGRPINSTESRYQWVEMKKNEHVPEAYALRRLPFLNTHAEEEDSEPKDEVQHDGQISRNRQSSITEFMKKRKSTSSATADSSKSHSVSAASTSGEPSAKKKKTSATMSSSSTTTTAS